MCFFQYSFIKYIDLIQEHLLNLARYKLIHFTSIIGPCTTSKVRGFKCTLSEILWVKNYASTGIRTHNLLTWHLMVLGISHLTASSHFSDRSPFPKLVATNILGGGGHLLAAVTSNLIETELANKPRFRALTFLCNFFYSSGGRRNMTSTTWTTTRPGWRSSTRRFFSCNQSFFKTCSQ